jgi:di/tricarboxylate transporter
MDAHGWVAVGTLVAATILFVLEAVPLAYVAMAIPVVLAVTGTVSPEIALSGFGNHAVISIAATFVVAMGLRESGVASLLARGVQRAGGSSESRLTLLVIVATCTVSAFMSNAATVAMLMPVVATLCRRARLAPSRMLLPMAYAATLAGTITVMGTQPNFLVADFLREKQDEAYLSEHPKASARIDFFDFAPVGLAITAVGALFLVTVGRRLLPRRTSEERLREARLPEDVAQSYGLAQNLFLLRLAPTSPLVGKSIVQAAVRSRYGLDVVSIRRPGPLGNRYLDVRANLVLEPNDVLYVEGEDESAWRFAESETLQFGLAGPRTLEGILGRGVTMVEATVAPNGEAVGRTFKELDLGRRFGVNVLSIWRGDQRTQGTAETRFQVGDTFLVTGTADQIRLLARDPDYIVLSDASLSENLNRAPWALAALAVALVPPMLGWLPIAASALAAALVVVLTRCVSPEGLRRCFDWKVLALIVGTVPLGAAMEQHGVASAIASGVELGSALGSWGVLAALFLLAAVVSGATSNAAAAVVLSPVALQAALGSGVPVVAALLAVAYGASCAFILPFSSQALILVMAPGGYRPLDFLRVGLVQSALMFLVAVSLLAWFA